jgi:hypothetical protein
MYNERLFHRLSNQLESLGALYREVSHEFADQQDLKLRKIQSETCQRLVEAIGAVDSQVEKLKAELGETLNEKPRRETYALTHLEEGWHVRFDTGIAPHFGLEPEYTIRQVIEHIGNRYPEYRPRLNTSQLEDYARQLTELVDVYGYQSFASRAAEALMRCAPSSLSWSKRIALEEQARTVFETGVGLEKLVKQLGSPGTQVEYFVLAEDIGYDEYKVDEIGPFYSAAEAFRALTSKVAFERSQLSLLRVPGLTEVGKPTEVAWYSWRRDLENSPPSWEGNGFRFNGEFLKELGFELDRSEGGQDAFLKATDRPLVLDLLRAEFYELLVGSPKRKETVQELLAHLDSTRSSPGLEYAIYTRDLPEQIVIGDKIEYCQHFDAAFRYEGIELGELSLQSKGDFVAGEWRAQPAEWPEFVKGLTQLRTVIGWRPDPEDYTVEDPAVRRGGLGERERAFLREKERSLAVSESKDFLRDGSTHSLSQERSMNPGGAKSL